MNDSMPEIVSGSFAPACLEPWPPRSIRVVDWNIDRGVQLRGVIDFLAGSGADLILLQEVDMNSRRAHHLNIAEEIARELRMNYVFGREFQELLQGSADSPAYHGQATLCRWRLRNPRLIRFRNQSGFWQPHWFVPRIEPFQVRLGGRIALVVRVQVAGRDLVSYNLHLESRRPEQLRVAQLEEALSDAASLEGGTPILIAGDLNLDSTHGKAATELRRFQFRNAVGPSPGPTTSRKLLLPGRRIDWAFIRGPIQTSQFEVQSSVHASDHFPVSFTVVF